MSVKQTTPTVLITGGTKGIGLAIGKSFAAAGYHCILTYAWGSVSEEDILAEFSAANLPAPSLKQADVSSPEDSDELFQQIAQEGRQVDVFISNVSFCNLVNSIDDYSEKGLLKSMEYSTWPLIDYPARMKKALGAYPRYNIALSSDGVDHAFTRYDFVAASKSMMEVLVRYLNYRFFDQGVIFNVVRTRPLLTDSLLSTMGAAFADFLQQHDIAGTQTEPEEVANAILMLCSGWMDGIRGQTITVDNGFSFADGLVGLYNEEEGLV